MSRSKACILAVAPVSRGFGFVVLDSSGRLLDWRVKETDAKPLQKNARCVFEVDRLIDRYKPDTLVLEDHRAHGSKKRKRVAELLDALTEHAIDCGVGVAAYGPREMRATLGLSPSVNKDKLSAEVAKHLPVLKARVPKVKRIWESESYVMPIFVAAALALTDLSRAQRRERQR